MNTGLESPWNKTDRSITNDCVCHQKTLCFFNSCMRSYRLNLRAQTSSDGGSGIFCCCCCCCKTDIRRPGKIFTKPKFTEIICYFYSSRRFSSGMILTSTDCVSQKIIVSILNLFFFNAVGPMSTILYLKRERRDKFVAE